MKKVYILTEKGSGYSDEGCEYLAEMLRDQRNETGELSFMMGDAYNKPERLKRYLDEDNGNSYVAFSSERIVIFTDDSIDVLKRALNDMPEKTSWECAQIVLEDTFGKDWEKE